MNKVKAKVKTKHMRTHSGQKLVLVHETVISSALSLHILPIFSILYIVLTTKV